MNNKNNSIALLPLFSEFIKKYPKYRLKVNKGKPLSPNVITSYKAVYTNLLAFQASSDTVIKVPLKAGNSLRELKRSNNSWANFYKSFSQYLFSKGLINNYVGMHFKNIKICLRWAEKEMNLNFGNYKDYLHVLKEETPIIALSMEQLRQAMDHEFTMSLSPEFQKTADLLLFGCCVGLRYSDLITLNKRNLEMRDGVLYLHQKSKKTNTPTVIRLPEFAISILDKYNSNKPLLLPYPNKYIFNKHLKEFGEIAGWTNVVGKERMRGGKKVEIMKADGKSYRFCDLLSSHIMRKTTITTLLMNGMPEHMVRRISGHSANSAEFYRYVQYSQNYIDTETEKAFNRIGFNKPSK